jgi:AcrR family transcriptional regulator
MEAIAREAGVSKQTVYRWWPTKAAIILEGLNEAAAVIAPASDTGSFEADLQRLIRRTVAGAGGRNGRLLASLMAAAQLDDAFAEAFRSGFLATRRQVLRDLLERGRERGELSSSTEPDVLVELVFAALWYRILVRNAPLDRRFADQLTAAVLALGGEFVGVDRLQRAKIRSGRPCGSAGPADPVDRLRDAWHDSTRFLLYISRLDDPVDDIPGDVFLVLSNFDARRGPPRTVAGDERP